MCKYASLNYITHIQIQYCSTLTLPYEWLNLKTMLCPLCSPADFRQLNIFHFKLLFSQSCEPVNQKPAAADGCFIAKLITVMNHKLGFYCAEITVGAVTVSPSSQSLGLCQWSYILMGRATHTIWFTQWSKWLEWCVKYWAQILNEMSQSLYLSSLV